MHVIMLTSNVASFLLSSSFLLRLLYRCRPQNRSPSTPVSHHPSLMSFISEAVLLTEVAALDDAIRVAVRVDNVPMMMTSLRHELVRFSSCMCLSPICSQTFRRGFSRWRTSTDLSTHRSSRNHGSTGCLRANTCDWGGRTE